jgi:hypothetical protein
MLSRIGDLFSKTISFILLSLVVSFWILMVFAVIISIVKNIHRLWS